MFRFSANREVRSHQLHRRSVIREWVNYDNPFLSSYLFGLGPTPFDLLTLDALMVTYVDHTLRSSSISLWRLENAPPLAIWLMGYIVPRASNLWIALDACLDSLSKRNSRFRLRLIRLGTDRGTTSCRTIIRVKSSCFGISRLIINWSST